MKTRIAWSVLTLSGLAFLACAKQPRTNETETARSLETPAAPATAPEPALTPASRTTEAPKKLGLEVITASQDGFRVTSTLVTGEKDAILIDAQFTLADAKRVADAVAASQRELKQVYVTHAHPDHYFGFPAIKERFPNAKLVALSETVAEIEKTWEAKVKQWKPQFKDAITSKPVIPEALTERSLDLEGQRLEIIGGVQGDAPNNSYVWIPSLRAAVAGDIVYDGVFPWTAETDADSRKTWRETLDRLMANRPDRVVPGHQKPDRPQTVAALSFTKDYLLAYDQALAASQSPAELQKKIKELYPDAELDVIVKIGAEAAFAAASTRGKPASTSTSKPMVPTPTGP